MSRAAQGLFMGFRVMTEACRECVARGPDYGDPQVYERYKKCSLGSMDSIIG